MKKQKKELHNPARKRKSMKFTFVLFLCIFCILANTGEGTKVAKGTTQSCSYIEEDPHDTEKENNENSFSDRSFPLLNCTAFSKTDLEKRYFVGSIRGFLLYRSTLQHFHLEDLRIFPNLLTLEFRTNPQLNLSNPNGSLRLSNVTSLAISQSGLEEIPTHLWKALPNLERLILSRNNITRVRGEDFDECLKLKSINLGHNPIKSFNASWLSRLPTVERLSLRATGIPDIARNFRKAKYLKFLDLSDNRLQNLTSKPFGSAANLTTLILANNKIATIHQKAFKGAINLRFIDLTENRIRTLVESSFSYSPRDELTVELWENPINCDCHMKWLKDWIDQENSYGNFPDIRLKCHYPAKNWGKKLIATDGMLLRSEDMTCSTKETYTTTTHATTTTTPNLTTTSKTTLSTQPSTEGPPLLCPDSCKCYQKRRDYIPSRKRLVIDHSFPCMLCIGSSYTTMPTNSSQNLGGVVMTRSKWTKVDLGELELPPRLVTLVLKKNQISELIPSSSANHSSIGTLSLEDNLITTISKEFLASFPNLRKLLLFNNHITKFADDTFFRNHHISKLFLGPNPLVTELNDNSFKNLPGLVNLGLRGINLRKVPMSIKNKVNLRILDLSDNFIEDVFKNAFYNCSSLIDISLENNNISFIQTGVFRNMPYLKHVDVSENRLTFIESGWFSKENVELSHVELWQNPIYCDCNLRDFVKWVKQTEHENPATEIRFRCEQPRRMEGKTSDETTIDEYTCESENFDQPTQMSPSSSGRVYSEKDLAIAIIVTAFLWTVVVLLAKYVATRYCCQSNSTGDKKIFGKPFYRFSALSSSLNSHLQLADENITDDPDIL